MLPYRALAANGRLSPAVPLRFIRPDGRTMPETLALLDSGADRTLLPAAWASALGIDLEAQCLAKLGDTAGGVATHYRYPRGVEAIFLGKRIRLLASFSHGLTVVMLGREDFFNLYRVAFDQRANTLTVSEY